MVVTLRSHTPSLHQLQLGARPVQVIHDKQESDELLQHANLHEIKKLPVKQAAFKQ